MIVGLLEGGEAAAHPPLPAVFYVFPVRWCFKVEGIFAYPGGGADDLVRQREPCIVKFFPYPGENRGVGCPVDEAAVPSVVAVRAQGQLMKIDGVGTVVLLLLV